MKWMLVAGARPNFIKIAPLMKAIAAHNQGGGEKIDAVLVHTGQHYDQRMSETFFQSLEIPEPDINLGVGSGSHAEQVGRTMIAFEEVVRSQKPDWVIVVGDVNATCACSITAKKEGVRLAHVEAGLRSFDWGMPEEINRMVTDRLSDALFTTDEIANRNLREEGVAEERIKPVGNIMIDSLELHRARAESIDLQKLVAENLIPGSSGSPLKEQIVLLTLHRPSNVDNKEVLSGLVNFFKEKAGEGASFIWPVHPRTEANLKAWDMWDDCCATENMNLLRPVGYLEMLKLQMSATIVLTDSGGLQEESCVLGAPCLTLRENTERPLTLEEHGGTCALVGNDIEKISAAYNRKISLEHVPFSPPLWDGKTAGRIVEELQSL